MKQKVAAEFRPLFEKAQVCTDNITHGKPVDRQSRLARTYFRKGEETEDGCDHFEFCQVLN